MFKVHLYSIKASFMSYTQLYYKVVYEKEFRSAVKKPKHLKYEVFASPINTDNQQS